MILKNFYLQKKEYINTLINADLSDKDAIPIGLYNDLIFKAKANVTFPLVMFKYNDVCWASSSEKEYKADVDFSVFIVLATGFEEDYLEVFDIAKKIDDAILLHPTVDELTENKTALANEEITMELISNSAFKIKEKQVVMPNDNWEKSEFFIWEINYKTTLIEQNYKKKYVMIANNFFTEDAINTEEGKEQVTNSLNKIGYDINDYYEKEKDGQPLLVHKEVEENLKIGEKEEIKLK